MGLIVELVPSPKAADTEKKLDIQVVDVRRGYGHAEYSGTCGPDVTVEDIKKRFYDPMFGGRGAWCSNGKWGAIEHTD